MSRIFTASMIFAAALTFVLSAADKTREQTLQRAIDMLESKGDLAKAVPLFEDAARSSDRAVAARALLYLGGAQERQGNEKARATYQRIVNEFGNQTETVAAAQQRLAALGVAGTPSVLAKRLLCADCGDQEADFSPDGRVMVFTDWESGDLATREMSTGKVKRLMAKPGNVPGAWRDLEPFGESPVLSRDLRQIVYCWETGENERRGQLRIMPNEPGGKARVLVDNPEYSYYEPTAWSPDGKSVLVILHIQRDYTQQFARVSVADGAVHVLKSMGWRSNQSSHPTFSPDGQYIVYHALAVNPSQQYPAATDLKDQHIYVLAADGSVETEVVKTSGINQFPVWTPDGKHILFISDRSGKFDLWSVAVQNGKAVGSPSLVTPNLGTVDAAAMVGSSYYYTNDIHTESVNIAEFAPPGNGQRRMAHATESFIGIQPSWSPDGKLVAVKRHHTGSVNAYDLVVHSLETGEERTYLTNLGTSLAGVTGWFHDGKSMLTGVNRSPYRVDLKTGEFAPVPAPFLSWGLSPDDKTLYVARYDPRDRDKLPVHILAVDLSNGQEKPVFTLPEPGHVSLGMTADGRTLVVCRRDDKTRTAHLYRLNVDGSGYREIGTIPGNPFPNNITLTKDGRWVLLAKRNDDDKNFQVVRIPIEGGAPESTGVELDKSLNRLGGIDLSPDGSRIAFTTNKSDSELWTIDNILSVLK